MKILIAEDDHVSRRMLESTLIQWSYEVIAAQNGIEALSVLEGENPPSLAILDVMMPDIDGFEICRRARQIVSLTTLPYIILLSARSEKESVVEGIEAGANDYLIKPFHPEELQVRIRVGLETAELHKKLSEHIRELENSLSQTNQLQGVLPICSYCKSIRDEANCWQQVENYISSHSAARFSHGICPDCYAQNVQPQLEVLKHKSGK